MAKPIKIKVLHIGEDYGTIRVNTKEYQVSLALAEHLFKLTKSK